MSDVTEEAKEDLWYQNGLRFECTQCGNCCSGPSSGYVWVTDAEVVAMAAAMRMSDRLDEFERKFVRTVGGRRSLVEYSDGDCIFLEPKTRGCMLYEARPEQCRSWPFWDRNLSSPQAWAQAARGCPGCNQGLLYSLVQIEEKKTGP